MEINNFSRKYGVCTIGVMERSVLKFERVTKLYGSYPALIDVSFSITAGEIFGLLGPNGAGKTTAISICSGLLKPNKGAVKIFGKDLSSDSLEARKLLGVVPQELALYEDLKATENLIFWGKLAGLTNGEARAKASDILDQFELGDRGQDRVKSFSGGMKRRMNIGCALMHDPKLLLLDEPTVGVDPQAREKMIAWMKEWVGDDRSILYTTHYLDEAERLCDTVAIIDDGRIIKSAPLHELLSPAGDSRTINVTGDFENLSDSEIQSIKSNFEILSQTSDSLSLLPKNELGAEESVHSLFTQKLQIKSVNFNRPGFHDIFLELTGKSLRD